MSASILINEIHPNPDSDSEWVELILVGDNDDEFNLTNYTIFDSARQIYKFSNETFDQQLLVVEVTGLNNDQDSVILKDNLENVVDSFSYTKTQKGLSWSRTPNTNAFALTTASRNQINQVPSPSPNITPILTATPTLNLSAAPTVSQSPTPMPTKNTNPPAQITQFPHYLLNKIQLHPETLERETRLSRLVFLGQKTAPLELKNAIIGSLLLILGASCLLYAKFKKPHS